MTTSGQCVSISPSALTIRNSGTMVTSAGTRSPTSTTTNSTCPPGSRIRANA
jgi:hypothetical protein